VLFVTQAARRAPEHGLAKVQANGGAAHQTPPSEAAPGSRARDCRPNRHALLDFDGTVSRLNEPGFAGVCPTASP
jgi:hypothetical protein